MQLYDPPQAETEVTWYFCAPGAPALPFWTRFGSGNFASARTDWFGPGEVLGASRPWSDGEPPGPFTIFVRTQLLPQWQTYSTPSFVGPLKLQAFAGHTIIVFVWTLSVTGSPTTVVVTDDQGNTYTQDATLTVPFGAAPGVHVWRGKAATTANLQFTVTFAAQVVACTFSAIDVEGLRDDVAPVVKTNNGVYPVQPSISGFNTGQGSSLVLATLNPLVMSGTTLPAGFTDLGSRFDMTGSTAPGNASYGLRDKRGLVPLAWTITGTATAPWVAAAVSYRGVPKYAPPPTSFCGSRKQWAEGGQPGEALKTDIYGVSTCCSKGKAKFYLSCDWLPDKIRCRILAIKNPSGMSGAFVGQEFDLDKTLLGFWASEFLWFFDQIWTGPQFLGIVCLEQLPDVLTLSANPQTGPLIAATDQRRAPPGALWVDFSWTIPFPAPPELWTVLLLTPSTLL